MATQSPLGEKVDILVVDDKPHKILALTAVLEELGENVVTATSGRDALRHLLAKSFAVILLDIDMPGMDGFEFAELVRSYRPSRHTPIIFMTAASDDALLARSYALGGVDYLPTPISPAMLRSKVRVFADLHKKNGEVERQAAALAEQAALMERLAAASLAVTSARSIEAIVQAIADEARKVVDAHQATVTVTIHAGHTESATSFSDRYAALRDHRPDRAYEGVQILAIPRFGSARITPTEIQSEGEAVTMGTSPPNPAPRATRETGPPPGPGRSFLSAPLTEPDGRLMGLVQVSEKREGDFSAADEAALVHLLQLGAVALQNCGNAEAREANRLKDEFLATLSHELRTPLHALLGWTHVLRKGMGDPAKVTRGLEVIERNVHLQVGLIDALLDVSRINAGKLVINTRPVSLASIVEAAMDALRPAAEAKAIQLRACFDEGAGHVLGDVDRLHQVASNLVGNAVKFTPRGGSVDVRVRREGSDALLVVSDDGPGIGPEFLPFVFDRFRQADSSSTRAHGGLGLGLAVVRHLVELHGGIVHVESPGIGCGATFTVRLPELAGSAPEPLLPDPDPTSRPLRELLDPPPYSGVHTLDGVRVLIVDDDRDARELVREILGQHHAHVTTVGSAREALSAIDAVAPHVLVSDIAMAGEDGFDLIRQVRRAHPGTTLPALALTAHAHDEDRLRALEAGFQMHAAKPIDPFQLVTAVAGLAGQRGDPAAGRS